MRIGMIEVNRCAAQAGYARAQLDLGYLYEQGKGVPLDYVSAYMWYRVALSGGEKRADSALKNLSAIMSAAQIQQALAAAATLPKSDAPTSAYAGDDSLGTFIGRR